MNQREMRRAMRAGKTLEYTGTSGMAWYDASKPRGHRFRFRSDAAKEQPLTVCWKWPGWKIRQEDTER